MIHLDWEKLTRTFVAEADEGLALMEEELVVLERTPSDVSPIEPMFRVAHTLKGSADSLGFPPITQLSHTLEDVLQELKDGAIKVTTKLTTLLLQAVDALRLMVIDVAEGSEKARTEYPEYAALHKALAKTKLDRKRKSSSKRATDEEIADQQIAAVSSSEGSWATGVRRRSTKTVRVDVEILDSILNLTGEIAISRGRLAEMLETDRGEAQQEDLLETHRDADRLYMDLQEMVMRARMVPLGPTFHQYARTVRDIATAQGKTAELAIEGEDVEVDMRMVDHLRDPLTHMIRNALGHGIEPAKERAAAGKPAAGRITLQAYHEGGSVVIRMCDDGRGLSRSSIIETARSRGMSGDFEAMSDQEVYQFILEAGFSTAERVSQLSGRGVGMDVVRRNIEALHGSVTISSQEGKGSTFTIRLPLTLAIMEGFGVEVGGEVYIIQLENVVECLELPTDASANGHDDGMLNLRGDVLPYVRLREILHQDGGSSAAEQESVVVVHHDDIRAGIVVDSLRGQSQAVVKPLGKMFANLPGVAGSTILGNGRVALILDIAVIVRDFVKHSGKNGAGNASAEPAVKSAPIAAPSVSELPGSTEPGRKAERSQ